MTTDRSKDNPDDFLAQALTDAQQHAPTLGADLRARIVADAALARPSPRPRKWRARIALPRLAPQLAGGAIAALAAFWVGVSLPMPVVAVDLPTWLDTPLTYLDLVTLHLVGLDDPLLMEF